MKPTFLLRHFLGLACSSLLAISSASAQTGTWNVDANGLWGTAGNWTPGIADGSGNTANFTNDITADRTVSLDGDRTLTSVVFGDSDTATAGSWILDNNAVSTNNLILAGTTPSITVNALGTGKTATISAIIEGTAGLVKNGDGTLILTNTNTYTGGTTISAGTLQVGNGAGTGSIGGNVSIAGGANLTINRTGPVNLGSSVISGNGSVTWQSGTSNSTFGTLSASNTFSGGFTLNGWIGSIGSGVYGGFGSSTVTIIGGALLVNSGATPTFNNTMRWNGNFAVDRGPSNVPTLTWGGDITLGANISVNGSAAGGGYTHIFNGRILDDTTPGRSLTFNTVGTGGRAFITLNGKNTFTGNLTLSRGSLTIGGTGNLGGGDYSGNISISLTATAPITYSSSSDQILKGNISGVTGLALTKNTSSTSTLTLAGTNSYAGGTSVNAGTLVFRNTAAKPSSGTHAFASGTTLGLGVGSTGFFGSTDINNAFAGTMTGNLSNVTVTATTSVAIDTTAGDFTHSADITGSPTKGLTKLGIHTLTLGGNNTYTGATTITGGTLVLTGATQATSAITLTTGSLGLDTGFPVTAASAAVNLSNGTIKVTGTTGAASYTLLTAASITGTPALAEAVPGYELQVIDGASDELRLVQSGGGSPYETWAGPGVAFNDDSNADGVSNGLAFLLGAATSGANATGLLPTTSQTGGNLVMSFTCLATADRGTATLTLEYDGDLAGTWLSAPVPGAVGAPNPIVVNTTSGSVSFVATDGGINGNGDALIIVVATISDATESASGKLFGRLKALNP